MSEWNADEYHRISALQKAMADERLASLTLKGSERILDIGCGDGKITAAVARRVPHGSVLGIDASREMIAFASSNFLQDNLHFENVDVRALTRRDEFDLILSFNALHWVVDQAAALRTIHTALKPTGRAILQFIPDRGGTTIEDMFEDVRCGRAGRRTSRSGRSPIFIWRRRCIAPSQSVTVSAWRASNSNRRAGTSAVETHSSPFVSAPSASGANASRRRSAALLRRVHPPFRRAGGDDGAAAEHGAVRAAEGGAGPSLICP